MYSCCFGVIKAPKHHQFLFHFSTECKQRNFEKHTVISFLFWLCFYSAAVAPIGKCPFPPAINRSRQFSAYKSELSVWSTILLQKGFRLALHPHVRTVIVISHRVGNISSSSKGTKSRLRAVQTLWPDDRFDCCLVFPKVTPSTVAEPPIAPFSFTRVCSQHCLLSACYSAVLLFWPQSVSLLTLILTVDLSSCHLRVQAHLTSPLPNFASSILPLETIVSLSSSRGPRL